MSKNKRKHFMRSALTGTVILILIAAYISASLLLPIKALSAPRPSTTLNITTQSSNLPWPKYGEGAVGLGNGSIIQSHGTQKPSPTASVAKLITALAVLSKHPLSIGQPGPDITIDATDYSIYTTYIAEQGSVVPVYQGEQLTEYQMLEAMLVPSGNNIADALARWAFGSLSAYFTYANTFVKQLGLNNTHVGGDASGFSPETTSTANNLIVLGSRVMANPVLAQIVDLKSVVIPNVGVMQNYNNILGVDGIEGIKTGNSNQAGGVFLSAATTNVNGHSVTILTALMGAPTLTQALTDTVPLVVSIENDFGQTILVSKGEVLGEFKQPWGGVVQIAASTNLTAYLLQGQSDRVDLSLSSLKIPAVSGTIVGTITTQPDALNPAQSVNVVTLSSTTKPNWSWRLTHPGYIF